MAKEVRRRIGILRHHLAEWIAPPGWGLCYRGLHPKSVGRDTVPLYAEDDPETW